MRWILPVALLFVLSVLSGCRVIGDRSLTALSPEEKSLIDAHRVKKNEPSRVKRISRELTGKSDNLELDEVRWAFKWSWDKGVATPGKPSKDNPEYDNDGNLIVSPEVARTYKIPDLHTGLGYDFTEDKLRALLEVELFELKVPKLRYLSVGVLGAEQFLGVHLSKRWTSIFEVESGIFCGYDFDTKATTWGISALVIKF